MEKEMILKLSIEKAVGNGFVCKNWQVLDFKGYKAKSIIFSHDFAKAFWKGNPLCHKCSYKWQHHLKEMVLEENPVKYLEQFLPKEEVK